MDAFWLLVDGKVGVAQLAAGDRRRVVGGAGGNLGALPANEGFWVASGWDWGLGAGVNLGALPANGCFLLASGWQVGGCPANGRRQAAGSWGHKGNLEALPANEGFLLAG